MNWLIEVGKLCVIGGYIKMYVREMNCEDVNWIGLTQVRNQWGTFMILTFEFFENCLPI